MKKIERRLLFLGLLLFVGLVFNGCACNSETYSVYGAGSGGCADNGYCTMGAGGHDLIGYETVTTCEGWFHTTSTRSFEPIKK